MLARPMVQRGALTPDQVVPGDLIAGGENILAGAISTVGAGTWTGAAIATGIIRRTGPVGGYTDTTDTAQAIINALGGNGPGVDVVPGSTFHLLFINTVAQAMTFAAGAGVVVGTGTLGCAASLVREYLVTVLNSTPTFVATCSTVNANAVITFRNPGSDTQTCAPLGSVTPGMSVSGTNITAGSTVLGVTQGFGTDANGKSVSGITSVTLSANASASTAAGVPVAITFSPTVQFDSLRSSTL
jgi:hypothetical protein